MSLVSCRYNPNHKVKSSRLTIHEKKCPDRYNGRAIQSEDDPNLKIVVGSVNYNESSSSSQKKNSDIKYMEKIKEQNIENEEETNKKYEELRKQMYSNENEYNERIKKENENNFFKKKKKKKKNTNKNQIDKPFGVKMDEIKNDNLDNNHFLDILDNLDNFSEEENDINENEFDNKNIY